MRAGLAVRTLEHWCREHAKRRRRMMMMIQSEVFDVDVGNMQR